MNAVPGLRSYGLSQTNDTAAFNNSLAMDAVVTLGSLIPGAGEAGEAFSLVDRGAATALTDVGTGIASGASCPLPNPAPLLSDGASESASETFYRTMSQAHYDELMATGRLPATSETFISPSLEYAQQYETLVSRCSLICSQVLTNSLLNIGVRGPGLSGPLYDGLPMVQRGWTSTNAFFKMEGGVVNTGLGNGAALDTFNSGIQSFHLPQ